MRSSRESPQTGFFAINRWNRLKKCRTRHLPPSQTKKSAVLSRLFGRGDKRPVLQAKWQSIWVLSSVGRAAPLQGVGREFEPLSTHQGKKRRRQISQQARVVGVVVQLVRIPACHAGGRGFESRPLRQYTKCPRKRAFSFHRLPTCVRLPRHPLTFPQTSNCADCQAGCHTIAASM